MRTLRLTHVRLLPLIIIGSIAVLSLTVSAMSGSEEASPQLLNIVQPDARPAASTWPTSVVGRAAPAPYAEFGRGGASTETNTAFEVEFVTVADPGSNGLVIAQPQAAVPGVGSRGMAEPVWPRDEAATVTQRFRRRDATLRATAADSPTTPERTATGGVGTFVSLATPTASPTPTTPYEAATATPTAVASRGPEMTATAAPAAPTLTAIPPTATAAVPAATATPSVTPTPTPALPTQTPLPATPTPTQTRPPSSATPTATAGVSAAARTATARAALPGNETVVSINTPTPTPTRTATPTSVPLTSTPTQTAAPTATTPSGTTLNSLALILATRGDHLLEHDIALVQPLPAYSWGHHGTEDTKQLTGGNNTVDPWLVVQRDASQINSNLNVRFNIRNIRCYAYQPSRGAWILIYSGLPGWMVSSDPTTVGGYTDVAPTVEPDGSYSFVVPVGKALHMAAGHWGSLSESGGILTTVEARLIGPDAGAARFAVAPGADYRTNGDFTTTNQSGFGHFGLLTAAWGTYNMLSSVLTDAQVTANPPPLQ